MTAAARAAAPLSTFERQRAGPCRAQAALWVAVPSIPKSVLASPAGTRLVAREAGTLPDDREIGEAGATRLGTSAGVNIARQAMDEAEAPEAAPTGY